MNTFKLLLLTMMVLQNSSVVLVGRYTQASVASKEDLYDTNHLIFITELAKLLCSMLLEWYTVRGHFLQSLQTHVFNQPLDALKIMVPALLYLIQNTLLYVALSHLTAPIFQVTYQAKLVTTAIVSVLMLNRVYSAQQWICLVILSLGVAIVVLGEGEKKNHQTEAENQNLVLGLVAVTIACFSSALAGVYFEKVLKKPAAVTTTPTAEGEEKDKDSTPAVSTPPPSLWMRNMQLAFFSVVIAFGQGIYQEVQKGKLLEQEGAAAAVAKPYMHGFNFWVWVLVGLQAGGGLLVAAVIKYADNVLKGLATGVSVVFATVLSVVLFRTPLSRQFSVGAVMILGSVYVFSNPITFATVRRSLKKQKKSNQSILPK